MATEQGGDTETGSKRRHQSLVGKAGQAEGICGGKVSWSHEEDPLGNGSPPSHRHPRCFQVDGGAWPHSVTQELRLQGLCSPCMGLPVGPRKGRQAWRSVGGRGPVGQA